MRTKTLGVLFLALMMASVWATYGVFTKKFTDYDEVVVHASRIGLQLPMRADVKIKGVIVGEVLDYEPTAEGADITLGLYQDRTTQVPRDVTASILPKTLFGEKFVSLIVPEGGSSAQPIADGDEIARTNLSIEVEQVLSDLYPLLRAVRPADLNSTLNAVATALEGRGEQLGETLETMDDYLTRFNPELPALIEDLRLTAEVSDTYADVLPEVAVILRNTITTTTTLEDREEKLKALFNDVSKLASVAERFTTNNGDNLVRLGDLAAEQLEVFARYAPGYPCLLGGIVGAGDLQAQAFRGFTLHIVLETLPNQPRGYTAADAPVYGDKRGPYCGQLPDPPWSQANPFTQQPDLVDGVDEPTGKGTSRVGPGWSGDAAGYVGGREESALLKSLLAPGLGVSADDVPDLGVLLVGPMARGAEVSLR
ncbi:phospholipid/cholesterol/gamma-HCH transport system substrate-binding protein [Nocardioides alpinus]|uniref:Phospholipid/cholesterol/gamma-HCH transport system substrate-binding protein n=1 Tax=Nocardioides alpinus TaxID=748909 RepID=A0A1I0YV98_9ACTN|nr:MCE family protein [Nocardioides alpinus]PKH43755.1 virulence factor Mce [Nocardioides alpinus]SFB16947.1 phospholipid/cholesterol/gamma-HCH transport system substrate-binding protein [Nocardioides alpinus]